MLLPKTEDVSNDKNYPPNNMSEHRLRDLHRDDWKLYEKSDADRNKIWDRSQLGTCSGVLGTVDQLVMDNAIMDEVRGKQRNLAVAFSTIRRHTTWCDMIGCSEYTDGWGFLKK